MKWREQVKYYIDFTFDLVKNQYEDIMFPCYGGRFYRFYYMYDILSAHRLSPALLTQKKILRR